MRASVVAEQVHWTCLSGAEAYPQPALQCAVNAMTWLANYSLLGNYRLSEREGGAASTLLGLAAATSTQLELQLSPGGPQVGCNTSSAGAARDKQSLA